MPIGCQSAFLGQLLEWALLPDVLVAFQVVENLRLQNEEAAVDPTSVADGLLNELPDEFAVNVLRAESPRRLHRGDRCVGIHRVMELK